MAYETWHEHAHAQERMRGILRRIAERWLHRDLAVAFTTWQENSDKQKRAEYITARIIKHWTHRTAAAAFDSWQSHAQDQVTGLERWRDSDVEAEAEGAEGGEDVV
jgi:hypothetical protein